MFWHQYFMPCLVREDYRINVSETAYCQSVSYFTFIHQLTAANMVRIWFPFICWLDLLWRVMELVKQSALGVCLGGWAKRDPPAVWDGKGQKAPWVGGDCAGILERQTSTSVCAAAGMFTLGLHLGCSLWFKAFVPLSLCFRGALGYLDRDHSSLQGC